MDENKRNITFGILFGCAIGGLFGYNCKFNNDFFEMPLYSLINIFVAIYFVYYLNQKNVDKRKYKDNVEFMINKMINTISEREFTDINCEDATLKALSIYKSFSNKLELVKKSSLKLKFVNEFEYICSEFKRCQELLGEHSTDYDYLKKSKKEFENYKINIESKLLEIMMKLYE